MKVQNINSQNFGTKNFRLPVKMVDFTEPKYGLCAPRVRIPVNYVREYENPDAERIYNEAMQIKDPFERAKKLAQMGHYRLTDMTFGEKVKSFFDSIKTTLLW